MRDRQTDKKEGKADQCGCMCVCVMGQPSQLSLHFMLISRQSLWRPSTPAPCLHAHTHRITRARKHTQSQTHTCTQTNTYTHTYSHVHAHTHKYPRAHKHTHAPKPTVQTHSRRAVCNHCTVSLSNYRSPASLWGALLYNPLPIMHEDSYLLHGDLNTLTHSLHLLAPLLPHCFWADQSSKKSSAWAIWGLAGAKKSKLLLGMKGPVVPKRHLTVLCLCGETEMGIYFKEIVWIVMVMIKGIKVIMGKVMKMIRGGGGGGGGGWQRRRRRWWWWFNWWWWWKWRWCWWWWWHRRCRWCGWGWWGRWRNWFNWRRWFKWRWSTTTKCLYQVFLHTDWWSQKKNRPSIHWKKWNCRVVYLKCIFTFD